MVVTGIVNPFAMETSFTVMDEIDTKEKFTLSLSDKDFYKTLLTFAKDYSCDSIVLKGPKRFLRGMRNEIHKEELNTYRQNSIKVVII